MTAGALRTLIVDDEPIARVRLRTLCGAMPDRVTVIGEAGDGRRALELVRHERPDLLLLDIAMPDLDGLGLATALRDAYLRPQIVFCTAYPSHALEAFDVAAADYLLKPISRDRLGKAVDKASRLAVGVASAAPPSAVLDHLWVPHRDAMVRVDMQDVERIEAEGDYVRLRTASASYLVHDSMARLEGRLDPLAFARVRRSLIVRADLLRSAEHLGGGVWQVALADGAVARVGPTYWKALKGRLRAEREII